MGRTIKNCLQCGEPYETNYFAERSKYCSRKCMSLHKKAIKKEKIKAEKKAKSIERQENQRILLNRKRKKERQTVLRETTLKNKEKFFVSNGDGTHRFGDQMLTLKNYKEPLKQIPIEEGIGWYGTLAADTTTGKIQCHLCGEMFDSLPFHIFNTHKIKVREYREKFGLSYTTALVSEQYRMKLKENTLEWLRKMTPEEKKEYIARLKTRGREAGGKSRGTRGLKKTMEAMNKDGSCPDQTLDAIKRVKEELGHVPSKKEFIDHKGSQRYVHLAYKHFGSWNKAIEMCRFDEEDFKERKEAGGERKYDDEELLEYLRIYVEEYNTIPTASDWKRDLLPTYDVYIRHFGSIENARQQAGIYERVDKSKQFLQKSKYYRRNYKLHKNI